VSHSKEKGAKGIVTSPLLPTIGGGGASGRKADEINPCLSSIHPSVRAADGEA